jgi:hypothetical protein
VGQDDIARQRVHQRPFEERTNSSPLGSRTLPGDLAVGGGPGHKLAIAVGKPSSP